MKKKLFYCLYLFVFLINLVAQKSEIYGVWPEGWLRTVRYGYAITDTEFKYVDFNTKEKTTYPYFLKDGKVYLDKNNSKSTSSKSPKVSEDIFEYERNGNFLTFYFKNRTVNCVSQTIINETKEKIFKTGCMLVGTGVTLYLGGKVLEKITNISVSLSPNDLQIANLQLDAIKLAKKKGLNNLKPQTELGNYGEMMQDIFMIGKGATPIHNRRMTSLTTSGHHGIDGIYQKGNYFIICEAKAGYEGMKPMAMLADTKTGPEMTNDWLWTPIQDKEFNGMNRVQAAVGKDMADKIWEAQKKGLVKRCMIHSTKDGNVEYIDLDELGLI